jgi:hypothetical protein
MKNNTLRTVLEWGIVTSLLLSIFFFVKFCFRSREYRTLQPQLQSEMAKYQYNQRVIQSLVNDCMEYRKTNPSIDPVLRSFNIQLPSDATPGKPAGK